MTNLVVISHVGHVRNTNEDNFLLFSDGQSADLSVGPALQWTVDPALAVFGVVDGMGGMEAGDLASALAVGALADHLRKPPTEPPFSAAFWNQAMDFANQAIYHRAEELGKTGQMGCTASLVLVTPEAALLAHVGDSRVYLYRGDVLTQLSEDQSLVQELVAAGELTAEEAAVHPQRNVVLQALGVQPAVRPQIASWTPEPADVILVCSDGLSGMIPDSTIREVLSGNGDLAQSGRDLVEAALGSGGTDNVTVVMAQAPASVETSTPVRPVSLQEFKPNEARPLVRPLWSWLAAPFVVALVLFVGFRVLGRPREPVPEKTEQASSRVLQDSALIDSMSAAAAADSARSESPINDRDTTIQEIPDSVASMLPLGQDTLRAAGHEGR